MGQIHGYKCGKCGKSGDIIYSVGMMYPDVCLNTKKKAAKGKFGPEWKQFIAEHPEGSFDCAHTVFVCECGNWCNRQKMDYYAVQDGAEEFGPYFTGDESFKGPVKRTRCMCSRCGKEMHTVSENQLTGLKCPDCGEGLKISWNIAMWD